ncbi:hypothetical protein G4G27_11745 [Sphingomonas sp. So64.6b]|uniref:hypothetical protein n=1 Tax=Sphingomonas sp. So64.6b TaxID=2997354 RepID=UPI0015FFED74|nr:hypothetical protein [Sphingomonas sp. So64.6b]QNA84586.1 hypothetical protein G4G27_11745 [Sphingomonas sp. So64.6b]
MPGAPFWVAAAIAVLAAILAGLGDHRRKRRVDLDRVGLINWPTLQMLALIAAAILVILAFHA